MSGKARSAAFVISPLNIVELTTKKKGLSQKAEKAVCHCGLYPQSPNNQCCFLGDSASYFDYAQ